jgi:hypothetical protein
MTVGMFLCDSPSKADFQEDFDAGQIDLSDWTVVKYGGLNGTQQGGKLIVNGTYDPGETVPNTGGWNLYDLVYHEDYTGYLDFSVVSNITDQSAQEIAVGIGVVQDFNIVYDNITSWVQYYYATTNTIGHLHCWHNESAVKIIMDDEDISVGKVHTHRFVVHENRSIQLLLDGSTKGWWEIYYPSYYPFIHVGIKYAGSYAEVEFDDFILIDSLPEAILGVSDFDPHVGDPVSFDGSQSSYGMGSLEAYFFDFGDGSSSGWMDSSGTTHVYSGDGSYDARLKVRADNGKESDWSHPIRIDVINLPPVAFLNTTTVEVVVGEEVFLDGSGSCDCDGYIAGYRFDFGDGETSGWLEDSYVTHVFAEEGEYQVSLLVRDNYDAESKEEAQILIVVKGKEVEQEAPILSWIVVIGILLVLLIISILVVLIQRRKLRQMEEETEGSS